MQSRVAIIVPVYQKNLKKAEKLSLRLLKKHLSKYHTIFLAPKNYNPPNELVNINNSSWEYFDDYYFTSVKKYSELLLTSTFYQRFLNFKFILIYQLDGLVLNENLDYWCDLNYSYIGAPWRYSFISLLSHAKHKFLDVTGNGGVSLRKVKDHYDLLKNLENKKNTSTNELINFLMSVLTFKSNSIWLKNKPSSYPFNEDGFWSLEAKKYDDSFKVSPVEISASFSLERYPIYFSNRYLHGKLPFAAHAWGKNEKEWWNQKLNEVTK